VLLRGGREGEQLLCVGEHLSRLLEATALETLVGVRSDQLDVHAANT